jgi:hypothetical protein
MPLEKVFHYARCAYAARVDIAVAAIARDARPRSNAL